MDILGSDRFSIERLLIQLLIPGLVAMAPFAWLYYMEYRQCDTCGVLGMLRANKEVAFFLCVVLAVGVGMVLENIGGRIEATLLRNMVCRSDINALKVWDLYLRTVVKEPPVAGYYLTSMLVRLKFLLCFLPAFTTATVGVGILLVQGHLHLCCTARLVVVTGLLGLSVLFAFDLYHLMLVLHKTRVRVLQGVGRAPADYWDPSASARLIPHTTVQFKNKVGYCTRCHKYPLHRYRTYGEFALVCRDPNSYTTPGTCAHLAEPGSFKWIHGSLLA